MESEREKEVEDYNYDFLVHRPDGGIMYAKCYDTAVRWGKILAQIFGQAILCKFNGERDEYPTPDMLLVTFLCTAGGAEHREDEDAGVFYDIDDFTGLGTAILDITIGHLGIPGIAHGERVGDG